MLPFRFSLAQILRYRESQRRVREAAVAAAAGRVASIGALRTRIETERTAEARVVTSGGAVRGESFGAWAGFSDRAARQIEALKKEEAQAGEILAKQQKSLRQADLDVRLIEQIKEDRLALWRRDFEREQSALADEAFRARRESGIIGKHRGA